MKKRILSFVTICLAASSFAQTVPLKKVPSVGIGFFLKDYVTPQTIKASTVSKVISDKTYARTEDMSPGIQVSYFKGLTSHVDFMGLLGGCFTKYYYKTKTFSIQQSFLLDLDAQVNLKLFTDKVILNPYLTTGVGGTLYNGKNVMANIPVGGGFQINIGDGSFIYLQSIYKYGITKDTKDNLSYQFVITTPLGKAKTPTPKVIPPPPPPPVVIAEKDTDGDGILDSKDKCPTEAGLAKYEGCPIPDTDKDGINDEEDKCPNTAGVAKYKGCPIPDTDGDGINDEEDKCPTKMGLARNEGCPIVDTDGDGINDDEDKCPTVAGVKENGGCPAVEVQTKINELAKKIYFKSGNTSINPASLAALNEVAAILKKYPTTKLIIEGHTDNVGSKELNKELSQKRADVLKEFFVKQGIDSKKLSAKGFGSEKPIGDNKTEAGRTQNRRVELKATY